MASQRDLSALQKQIWSGSIPLEIRLASTECRTYDDSDPYLIQVPRLSYIPFLLPRLHAFFAPSLIDPDVHPSKGWLSYSDVPLKWHHPLGLLYDLYSGFEPYTPDSLHQPTNPEPPSPPPPSSSSSPTTPTTSGGEPSLLPWRLTAHFTTPAPASLVPLDAAYKAHHDAFVNAVKEADFLRNGSAKAAMSLSKDASDRLWDAVGRNDLAAWNAVHGRLLVSPPGAGPLRHVPMKLYLPGAPTTASGSSGGNNGGAGTAARGAEDAAGAAAMAGAEGGDAAAAAAMTTTTTESPAPAGSASSIASLRVVQALVPPTLNSSSSGGGGASSRGGAAGQPQTMGTALNTIIPTLFPSRRSPLLAQPVLHGAVVPLSAPVEDLLKAAAYPDGFLHVAIVMMS